MDREKGGKHMGESVELPPVQRTEPESLQRPSGVDSGSRNSSSSRSRGHSSTTRLVLVSGVFWGVDVANHGW